MYDNDIHANKQFYKIPSNEVTFINKETVKRIHPETLLQTSVDVYVYEIKHNLNTYTLYGCVYCENSNLSPYAIKIVDKETILVQVPTDGAYEVVLVY